jgi:hypothetical protein
MGDIARQSHLPDGSHSKDISQNLVLRLIAENSCHIMLIQEAASLQFPAFAAYMESYGLTAKFSTSGNLCIVARALQPLPETSTTAALAGSIEIIWEDESQEACPSLACNICFGKDNDGVDIARSGFTNIKAVTFHIHHNVRSKMGTHRTAFAKMLQNCLDHQVDVFGGDCNGGIHVSSKKQSVNDVTNSMVNVLVRGAAHMLNEQLPWHQHLGVTLLSNNNYDQLSENDDLDCMGLFFFSWGKLH